jgi:hypothetical protein
MGLPCPPASRRFQRICFSEQTKTASYTGISRFCPQLTNHFRTVCIARIAAADRCSHHGTGAFPEGIFPFLDAGHGARIFSVFCGGPIAAGGHPPGKDVRVVPRG